MIGVDRTISLFSAEASGPGLADLAGLLCGQGQITGFGRTAARLSVVVEEPWRAHVLARECRRRGADAQVAVAECGSPQVRTSFRVDLLPLALRWLRAGCTGPAEDDSGKAVPDGFRLSGAMLRMWALASGRPGPSGYLLGVDPLAPRMHEGLLAALAPLGVHARLLGPKAEAPAVRVNGRRRLDSLVELIGEPPAGAEAAWPDLNRDPNPDRESGLSVSEDCAEEAVREGAPDGDGESGEKDSRAGKSRRGVAARGRRVSGEGARDSGDDGESGQTRGVLAEDGREADGAQDSARKTARNGSKVEGDRRRSRRSEGSRRGRAAGSAEGDPRRDQSDESPLQYLLGVAG
jgi:hypothetical protein